MAAPQGDAVSENEPFTTAFVWTGLVSQGRIRRIKMDIFSDRTMRDAPVAKDENVHKLAVVEADVSHIPENMLARRMGTDGQMYYELRCKIEAVYLSASTTYTLLFNSTCFPPFMRTCLLVLGFLPRLLLVLDEING